MQIGISFFAQNCDRPFPYRLFVDAAKKADQLGLSSIWIPERHYHEFGGAFPNPAVAASAVSAITEQIEIRAGSVVSPLHDALEVAEQWSMVHSLSNGRAGLAFASGWKEEDFATCPANFKDRKALMWKQIDEIRSLFKGERISRRKADGSSIHVGIFPKPDFPSPKIWVTTSGDIETAKQAGKIGAGLFTHMVNQSVSRLAETISTYRAALPREATGHVTLMAHTFVAETDKEARELTYEPLATYLEQFLDLKSDQKSDLQSDEVRKRIELSTMRYHKGHSLIGSAGTCRNVMRTLSSAGVDEIASLIDFGLEGKLVMEGLDRLAKLQDPD